MRGAARDGDRGELPARHGGGRPAPGRAGDEEPRGRLPPRPGVDRGILRAYLAHLPAGAVVLTPPDHSYADAGFGVATVERYDDGTFGAPKAVGVAPDGKRYRVAVVVR